MSVFNPDHVNGQAKETSVSGTSKKFPLEPIGDVVFIELHELPDKTSGGLILPEMRNVDPRMALLWGTVVAAGEGVYSQNGARLPVNCKTGEVVFFPQIAAVPFNPAFLTMLHTKGVDVEYAKKVVVVQCQHITGKIRI